MFEFTVAIQADMEVMAAEETVEDTMEEDTIIKFITTEDNTTGDIAEDNVKE